MPEWGASGSVGAPLDNLRALPGNGSPPYGGYPPIYSVCSLDLRCSLREE
jgi:hypothetical protein